MKPFRTLVLYCVLATVPSLAYADPPATSITLENQDVVRGGSVEPDMNGTIVRMLYGPLGAYSSFYVDGSYARAIVGPLYSPTKWLAVGTGVGLEQAPGSWRAGGMIWLGFEHYVSTTSVEYGASGFWAREEFAWKPRSWIGLGALGDTAIGYGPRVELNVPHTPIQIWGAMPYDKGGNGAVPVFGFRLNL